MAGRPPKLGPNEVTRMKELRAQGLSYRKIGQRVGINRNRVRKYLDPEYRESWNTWRREHRHRTQIRTTINGKSVVLKFGKRSRPDKCELCDSLPAFQWHHWNDEHPELGMWLCRRCHHFVEAIDSGLNTSHLEKYLSVKEESNGNRRQGGCIGVNQEIGEGT